MSYVRWIVASFGFVAVSASSSLVLATYSIAATDSASEQVGGAITSCVGSLDLASVYGSVPGAGVVHAQAQLDTRLRGKNRAVQLIEQGVAPAEIIAMITASDVDSGFASRQYGVVDVQGRAAGFTGAQAQAYKKDQQARVGSFAYSVQGNILTSQRVLDQAAAGFEANACDLADRLMAALEAGGNNGEGDSRCTRSGIPSDAAFIQVDLPGQPAGSWLRLSVSDTAPENPLPKLRAMFDTWRKSHPCMPGTGSGGTGAAGSGGGGASGGGPGTGAAATGGSPAGGVGAIAGSAGMSGPAAGSTGGAAGQAASIAGNSASAGSGGTIASAGRSAGAAGRAEAIGGAGGRVGNAESSVGAAGASAGTTGQNTGSGGPTCAGSGPATAGACAAPSASRGSEGCALMGMGTSRARAADAIGGALVAGLLGLRMRRRRRPMRTAPQL